MKKEISAHLLVLRKDNQEVLLTKRCDIPIWVIPGGHKEAEETLEEACLREFKEETNCTGVIDALVASYISEDKEIEKHLFIGHATGGLPLPTKESQEVTWFSVENLPPTLLLYERERIRTCLNFDGSPKKKVYKIHYYKEIRNQLQCPLHFINLIFNSLSYKIKVGLKFWLI